MKSLLYTFVLLLLFSCSNNAEQPDTSADSAVMPETALKDSELAPEHLTSSKVNYFVWEVDANARTIKKNPLLQSHYFQVDTLITGLNQRYPQILLEKKTLSRDTLYTTIQNASYLTEQMGSLGAEQYIAQAVLNLTAVEGIRFVRIDFKEGSHAAPDVWSRDMFSGYTEVQ